MKIPPIFHAEDDEQQHLNKMTRSYGSKWTLNAYVALGNTRCSPSERPAPLFPPGGPFGPSFPKNSNHHEVFSLRHLFHKWPLIISAATYTLTRRNRSGIPPQSTRTVSDPLRYVDPPLSCPAWGLLRPHKSFYGLEDHCVMKNSYGRCTSRSSVERTSPDKFPSPPPPRS